jgi:diguanylate cyclase (GGDEF)-like protein
VSDSVIVVVHADPAWRRAARAALDDAGWRVLEASTGVQALTCWRAANPEVIILDADLPDAAEALTTVATARRRDQRVAVITVSADPSPARVAACLRQGAWQHARAPLDLTELVAQAEAALRVASEQGRLRRRNEELEYLGSTDALTGLANRRHVEEELARQASAAARHHHALSAVMLAIDRWPELATAGLASCDAIVQEVAVLIRAICRTDDLAGRYSDDEFLVVLPMTDGTGAQVFAERVRAVVAAAPIQTDIGPVDVSLSAGCATGAPGADELLERALAALRQARRAGGNSLAAISS